MLLAHLRQFFLAQNLNQNFYIAFSGGMDSHALLAAACELKTTYPLQLKAVHVNHGLSKESDRWARHCEEICKQYQIPFVLRKIEVCPEKGQSLEEVARQKRYAVLASLLTSNDILLTAHQQDDQAETLLLQLLRGAGLKGLAAMPLFKNLGKGKLVRPLLHVPRAQLEIYARHKNLTWIEDESNHNHQLTRNFLRQQILPLLRTRWPNVSNVLARTAMHVSEAELLLNEQAQQALQHHQGTKPGTLSVAKVLANNQPIQRLLLRTWIMQSGFSLPSTKKLNHIQEDVLLAKPDKTPLVKWQGACVRRYRDDLYLLIQQPSVKRSPLTWELTQALHIPDLGYLIARPCLGGIKSSSQAMEVRFRQGGEFLRWAGHARHPLKNLWQSLGVPPWERDNIPLIYANGELIAAVGYFTVPHVCVQPHEVGFAISIEKAPS